MKPKAAIVYLSRSTQDDLRDIKRSLALLDRNFNDRYRYPVIVFNEDFTTAIEDQIRSWTRSEMKFAHVDFRLPEFVDPTEVPEKILGRFGVGYRHMCRFFAGLIYEHPALEKYQWYWRFDTDSFLLSPVKYDVFEFMEFKGKDYGYMTLLKERPEVVVGLWDAVQAYARDHSIPQERLAHLRDPSGEYNLLYYYNNFEICRLAFGRSVEYQSFFRYIDRLKGIYTHRWGDAPIRTFGVALMIPPERRHRFGDLGYAHSGYYSSFRLKLQERVPEILRQWCGLKPPNE